MATTYAGGGNGISSSRSSVTYYNPLTEGSKNTSITNLLGGSKWGGAIGAGVTLTTSFSTSNSEYGYSTGDTDAIAMFSSTQISGARNAMTAWSAVAKITFIETTDSASSAGDIRWSQSRNTSTSTAYAYYPSTHPAGGDIWFGPNYSGYYGNPVVGTYGYQTYLHELGHALGLDHPHEGPVTAASGQDQLKYSIMSYRSYANAPLTGYTTAFFPTTPMLNDILSIQYLYGANMAYRTGNDTYRWDASKSVFETIWDAGGTDTLDGSNQLHSITLDLRSGYWSSIGKSFWNGQAYVRDCLTIAYGATIENATGSTYNDTLIGNDVANVLKGGFGADRMTGGLGNDTYYVDNSSDVVTETSTLLSEIDTVISTITYTLGANLEKLVLSGTSAINGTGNTLANTLSGNSAANILNGGSGADRLIGGLGNDTYYVDNSSDVVTETSTLLSAIDTVISTVTYTLGANLEKLVLSGTSAINGTGNTLANTLSGNSTANILNGGSGADRLFGGFGNDSLTGGAGGDAFVFDSLLNTTNNRDTITDFTLGSDKIWLDQTYFSRFSTLGSLSSLLFRSSSNGLAGDSNDYILYNTTTGSLSYDFDGNGSGLSVTFANLSNKPLGLAATDFLVIA